MKKGDRVELLDWAERYTFRLQGTILKVDETEEPPITVEWDNGETNHYRERDLIYMPKLEPAFDRTAIATQILSGMMPQRTTKDIIQRKDEIVKQAIELTDELIKQLSE